MVLRTLILLVMANVFMTFAWYGHLKYREIPIWKAILLSWGLAFVEYCIQVPANRWGYHEGMTGYQLKIFQEVVTLTVFIVFAWFYLGEALQVKHIISFLLMLGAVAVAFQ